MYQEFDVVLLSSGEEVTILEIYDDEHFLAEEVFKDGRGKLHDICIGDIADCVWHYASSATAK